MLAGLLPATTSALALTCGCGLGIMAPTPFRAGNRCSTILPFSIWPSPAISRPFPPLQALLERGDRPDWNEHKLRTACWEGVASLVSDASAEAEHPYLHTLLAEVGRRLTAAVTAPPPTTADAAEDLESRLVLLTAMLQDIVSELDEEVAPLAGSIGDLLIKVLSARKSFASESAFFALSALCDAVGEAFQPLLPACMPLVMRGVTDVEHNSAYSAIMAAGVLIRCGPAGVAYVDELVTEVLKALSNPEVPRNAKAAALAVFGDIAVAMGPQVSKFVAGIMGMLGRAAGTDREARHTESHCCNALVLRSLWAALKLRRRIAAAA